MCWTNRSGCAASQTAWKESTVDDQHTSPPAPSTGGTWGGGGRSSMQVRTTHRNVNTLLTNTDLMWSRGSVSCKIWLGGISTPRPPTHYIPASCWQTHALTHSCTTYLRINRSQLTSTYQFHTLATFIRAAPYSQTMETTCAEHTYQLDYALNYPRQISYIDSTCPYRQYLSILSGLSSLHAWSGGL